MERLDIKKLDPDFKNRVARELGGEHIRKCYACGVCSARCPIEKIEPEYNPRKIIRMIILGLEEDLLKEELLWHCSNCYTCQPSLSGKLMAFIFSAVPIWIHLVFNMVASSSIISLSCF